METTIEKGSAKVIFSHPGYKEDNPNMVRVRFAGTEKDLLTTFSFSFEPDADDDRLDLCVTVNEKYKSENCTPRSKVMGTDSITLCQGDFSKVKNLWDQGIIPQIEKAKFNVSAVFNHSEEYLNEIVKKAQKKALEAWPDFQKETKLQQEKELKKQQAQIQYELSHQSVKR